jgi:hypothetical protein
VKAHPINGVCHTVRNKKLLIVESGLRCHTNIDRQNGGISAQLPRRRLVKHEGVLKAAQLDFLKLSRNNRHRVEIPVLHPFPDITGHIEQPVRASTGRVAAYLTGYAFAAAGATEVSQGTQVGVKQNSSRGFGVLTVCSPPDFKGETRRLRSRRQQSCHRPPAGVLFLKESRDWTHQIWSSIHMG